MEDLIVKVQTLQNMLIGRATGEHPDNDEYVSLRNEVVSNSKLSRNLPRFVKTCRNLQQFWGFIKPKFGTYQERRQFIWDEFAPLLNRLEEQSTAPSDPSVSSVLSDLEVDHISEAWSKAADRRASDPEGAITQARTLLESVCKLILDEENVAYDSSEKFPKLYHKTAKQLNLAPSQHTEDLFKAILGNCQAVIGKLGAIRNAHGDAHGEGTKSYRPAARHAELAVNLSGATATFLVRTWKAQR